MINCILTALSIAGFFIGYGSSGNFIRYGSSLYDAGNLLFNSCDHAVGCNGYFGLHGSSGIGYPVGTRGFFGLDTIFTGYGSQGDFAGCRKSALNLPINCD